MQLRVIRLDRQSRLELLDGSIQIALLQIGDTQVLVEDWIVRAQQQSALIDRKRLLRFAGLHQRQTQVDQHGGILWSSLSNLPEERQRLLDIPVTLECE